MALFKRIHEVALPLLNLFKLSSRKKKKKITSTLKVGTSKVQDLYAMLCGFI